MKILNDLRRRGLALFLVLTMCLGMIPGTAFAADQSQGAREASITDKHYFSLNRDSVEFNYRLDGVRTDVRFVCLWDKTAGNPAAWAISAQLDRMDRLCGKKRPPEAITISYSNYAVVKEELTGAVSGEIGQGQSNEKVALETATEAIRELSSDGRPLVVLWVPSTNLDGRPQSNKDEITAALEDFQSAISAKGGTLVTWQMAESPSELLASANATASPANRFSQEVGDWLEKVLTDHIDGFKLTFSPVGELGKKVTNVTSNMGEVTYDEANGTATVSIDRFYDHQDLYVTVTAALDEGVYPKTKEEVVVCAKTEGDHRTGWDDETTNVPRPTFPDGTADRMLREIAFTNSENGPKTFTPPESLEALPGQLVVLPDASGQNAPGAAFDWWRAPDRTLYKPGQAVAMPEADRTEFTAQWGHVEVELHVTGVTAPAPVKNRMVVTPQCEYNLLNIKSCKSLVVSVKFETERVSFTSTDGYYDTGAEGKVLKDGQTYDAKFVGATPQDEVIAYLVPQNTNPQTYEMRIAGEGGVTSWDCHTLFYGFDNLKTVDLTKLKLTNTKDGLEDMSTLGNMREMFAGCRRLENLILPEDLKTFEMTNTSSMFYNCISLTNLDVSSFNTSKVTNMNSMFQDCGHLQSLNLGNDFDTSGVTGGMNFMFYHCIKLKSLELPEKFNTSNVTDMSNMFQECSSLESLTLPESFNTDKVRDMSKMFNGCTRLKSLTLPKNFRSANGVPTTMNSMFARCSGLTILDLSGLNTSNVTDMASMFANCEKLTTLDVSNFKTSNVTEMSCMFSGCSSLSSLDLRSFTTSKVTNMASMFNGCYALGSLTLSENFDTSKVRDMQQMFSGCKCLRSLDLSSFKTTNVYWMNEMFYECWLLGSLDLSSFDTSNVAYMYKMFYQCKALSSLDVSNFNTSKVMQMGQMFYGCERLEKLNVSTFDTSQVTNMSGMFSNCKALTSLDVSGFKVKSGSGSSMSSMFANCTSLTEGGPGSKCLNLTNFDTSNATSIRDMFWCCTKLTKLDLEGTKFYLPNENLSWTDSPFFGCTGLQSVTGIHLKSSYDSSLKLEKMFQNLGSLETVSFLPDGGKSEMSKLASLQGMFNGCPNLKSVDLSGWDLPELSDLTSMFAVNSTTGNSNDVTINLSWTGVHDPSGMDVTDIAKNRTGNITLIVGEEYAPSGEDDYSKTMAKIIKEFPEGRTTAYSKGTYDSETGKWTVKEEDQVYPVSTYTTNPVTPAYTVETWLEDQTEAAKTETVEYTEADVTVAGDGDTTTTTYTIPTVKGYDFDYALSGGSEEHLTVEGMTVTFPVTGNPENDVLKLYYTPKMVEYTVKYYVDGEINDGLTESFEVKDGEKITSYTNNCPVGWHLNEELSTEMPFTVKDGEENVIQVYYAKDVTMVEYTVEYYVDEVRTETRTETVKDGTEIGAYPDRQPTGYHLDKDRSTVLPFVVTDGWENIIRVYYVKDVTTPATVQYTVRYYVDGEMDDSLTETLEAEDGTEINGYPDHCPEGWHLEKTENLPLTVADGEENVIRVYYVQNDQEGGTDDSKFPEGGTEGGTDDPALQEDGEIQEGGEALSLARSARNQRMAVVDEETGATKYEEVDLVGPNPDYSKPIVTAIVPTPKDSELTYKVVVKYTGDDGVQSGRIDIRYPLPKGVKAAENPNIQIGGTAEDEPSIVRLEEFKLDGGVLTGAISGLPAGVDSKGRPFTYEVSINCVLETLNEPEDDNGYYYWDGTAYAQTSNEAVSSNIMRLWWQKDADPEKPEPTDVRVDYQFVGTVVPEGVEVPGTQTVKAGDPVTLATVSVPAGYTFDGWYRLNGDGTKIEMGTSCNTTGDDVATGVTFYGRWKIDPATAEFVTIKYKLGENAPVGASLPTSEFTVPRGAIHNVIEMAKDVVANYDFNGWTLNNSPFTEKTIDTSKYQANAEIVLTGSWTPHTGIVKFDANGGDGSMGDQEITLANPGNLNKNAYEEGQQHITWDHHNFLGWATTQDKANAGTVEYADDASAAGLITEKDQTVTLYAVWAQEPVGYTVKYFYNEKEGTAPSGALTTGTGLVGTTTGVAAPEQVTIGEGTEAKHYALDRIEQITIQAEENANIVKVYYATDEIGKTPDPDPDNPNPKPTEPDGIPDKYQVTVVYTAGPGGSIEGGDKEVVLTIRNEGDLAESGYVKFPAAKAVPTSVSEENKTLYAFTEWTAKADPDEADKWTYTGNLASDTLNEAIQHVTGGTTYTLTANFAADTSTVTFAWNAPDGVKPAADYPAVPQTVNNGEKATKPETDPSLDKDYAFLGWYQDKDGKTKYTFTEAVTRDTTVYAAWDLLPKLKEVEKSLPEDVTSVKAGDTVTYTVTITPAEGAGAIAGFKLKDPKLTDSTVQKLTVTVDGTDVTATIPATADKDGVFDVKLSKATTAAITVTYEYEVTAASPDSDGKVTNTVTVTPYTAKGSDGKPVDGEKEVTYTKSITKVEKVLSEDKAVIIGANANSVTLHYTITVTGEEGAQFKITDAGATLTPPAGLVVENGVYTLGNTGEAIFTATKDFAVENGKVKEDALTADGALSNTVSVAPGGTDTVIPTGDEDDRTAKAYQVSYEFTGAAPEKVAVPEAMIVKEKDSVDVSTKYTVDGKVGNYVFKGWTCDDSDVKISNNSFTMPGHNVVLKGTWELAAPGTPTVAKAAYGDDKHTTELKTVTPGETIYYKITITPDVNGGKVKSFKIVDTLVSDLKTAGATVSAEGSWSDAQTYVLNEATPDAITVTYSYQVPADTNGAAEITNKATVTVSKGDTPGDEDPAGSSEEVKTPLAYAIAVKVTNGTAKAPTLSGVETWSTTGTEGNTTTYLCKMRSGGSLMLTFTGSTGYALDPNAVMVDGTAAELADGESYSFTDVNANHTIEVAYAEDTKGGPTDPSKPEEKGDGIPDKYQKEVTFAVEHGKWSDGTSDDIVKYVELKDPDTGKWSESGSGTLTPPTDMTPDKGYKADGADWNPKIPESNTVSGTEAVKYTYTFVGDGKTVTYPEFKDEDKDEKPDKEPENTTTNVQVGKTVTVDLNEGSWTDEQKKGWTPTDDKDVFTQEMEKDITLPTPTKEGYVFVGWIKTEETDPETDEKTGNVKFTAQYLPDTNSDGIPDKYQKKVTFTVENGKWSDGTATDIVVYVELKDATGKWSETGSGALTVPTGMTPNEGYTGGSWSGTVPTTVTGNADVTYTYRFTNGTHTVTWVDYDHVTVLHGPITVNNGEENPPASDCPTPTRPDDGRRTWTFYRWLVSTDDSGNVTYTAQYRGVLLDDGDDNPGGGGGGTGGNGGNTGTGGNNGTVIYDPEVPLGAPGLNSVDHFDYIKGYSDGTVQPEANITRAEVATIFFRLMTNEYRTENWSTENSFSDVKSSSWYNNAVSTAAKAGILEGYPNGSFQPNKTITRAEFAAIAARFASEAVPSGKMFSDIEGHWAQESIERASAAGWIRGNNGKFRPNDQITRAEVVTAINRMLDRIPDAEHMLEGMRTFPDNVPGKWYYADIQEATNSHDYERGENGSDEIWTALLPEQDWAALEKEWANAADANVNDVASGLKEED